MSETLTHDPEAGPPYDPEGPETEWKERLPGHQRVARTLAAFANGVGGSFWVGVRDDGLAVGVGRPSAVCQTLRRIAAEETWPQVELELRRHRVGERTLVEARVAGSSRRPVFAPGRDRTPTAFVRDGASTRKAPFTLLRSWRRASTDDPLDARLRRVLRAISTRAAFDVRGPNAQDLAAAARLGARATRRALAELELRGLASDRGAGHYGLTPRGHRRVRPS